MFDSMNSFEASTPTEEPQKINDKHTRGNSEINHTNDKDAKPLSGPQFLPSRVNFHGFVLDWRAVAPDGTFIHVFLSEHRFILLLVHSRRSQESLMPWFLTIRATARGSVGNQRRQQVGGVDQRQGRGRRRVPWKESQNNCWSGGQGRQLRRRVNHWAVHISVSTSKKLILGRKGEAKNGRMDRTLSGLL